MIIINDKPPQKEEELASLYPRMPVEGVVQSSLMCGERYGESSSFDEDWSCPSITWAAGGEEKYLFSQGGAVTMRSAGALTLSQGARYAYEASKEYPFRSNMIIFPRWITDAAGVDPLEERSNNDVRLETRPFMPDECIFATMNGIAVRCANGEDDEVWYAEQSALLYDMLLGEQEKTDARRAGIDTAKASTRSELVRRVKRAQYFILENYAAQEIDLSMLAKVACLSTYHFVRVFKAMTGSTPAQFLSATRMDAARRLIGERKMTIADVAAAVGYGDRTAFFRAFRRRFGKAPSAFFRN